MNHYIKISVNNILLTEINNRKTRFLSNRYLFISILFFYCQFFSISISFSQTAKINKVYSIACHNCYERKYAPDIEDALSYTTNIEIDIWDSRWLSGGWKAMTQDWYVKHSPSDKGNNNCCGGSFSDCLKRIKKWSDNNPEHKVISVFIDKKENWSERDESRKPIDLDNLLVSIFLRENIYTPFQLKGYNPSIRDALQNGNVPSLDSLKGKIVFIITDGTLFTTKNKILDDYINNRKNDAICFVSPQIESQDEIFHPSGISEQNVSEIIYYNLEYSKADLAMKISDINLMSRVFGSSENIETINNLISRKVNFIALYDYKIH